MKQFVSISSKGKSEIDFSKSTREYLEFLGKEIFDMQYIYFDGKGNTKIVGYLERSKMDPDDLKNLEVA